MQINNTSKYSVKKIYFRKHFEFMIQDDSLLFAALAYAGIAIVVFSTLSSWRFIVELTISLNSNFSI